MLVWCCIHVPRVGYPAEELVDVESFALASVVVEGVCEFGRKLGSQVACLTAGQTLPEHVQGGGDRRLCVLAALDQFCCTFLTYSS